MTTDDELWAIRAKHDDSIAIITIIIIIFFKCTLGSIDPEG